MKQLRTIATIILAITIFASCKKDETQPNNNGNNNNTNTTPKTPQELIIGTWVITSQSYKMGGEQPLEDCVKDNTMTIKTNGSYTIDQGAVKCNPTAPQSTDGAWLMDNYPTIFFQSTEPGSEGTTAKIIQLDETILKFTEYEGEPSEVTITFKRK